MARTFRLTRQSLPQLFAVGIRTMVVVAVQGAPGTVSNCRRRVVRPGRDGNDRRLITMTRGLRQKHTVITRLIIVVQTERDLVRLNVRDRLAALWQRPLSESMEIYGIFMRDKRLSGLIKACRNRKLSAT